MELKVTGKPPAPRGSHLTAIIDLGKECRLFDEDATGQHPAWSDVERRRRQGELTKPYLATGEEPLIYLPAAAARHWDSRDRIRMLAAMAWDAACERNADSLIVRLEGPDGAEMAPLVAEGLALKAYRFDVYKTLGKPDKVPEATFVCPGEGLSATREKVRRALQIMASVDRARDLINEPGSVATPAEIEKRAREVVKRHEGLKLTVLQPRQLEKEGYNGLLTVGKGGNVPPRLLVLSYNPKVERVNNHVHLGLLGKGITFDTGGYSLKPSSGMVDMKGDMSGASAVLYAIEAIAGLGLPIRVTAAIPAAQNHVDANAVVPGDIFTARNGKTVCVENTDAEGRLVMTDAMYRLGEEGVTHLVDVATLTGACMRALGNAVTGLFANDEFGEMVGEVAAEQGEPTWKLPIIEEYRPWLDHPVADLNNMSSVPLLAGATIAALFLREFVPENTHWVHLDIAGTFTSKQGRKYYPAGATGIMVRTLTALAEHMAEEE